MLSQTSGRSALMVRLALDKLKATSVSAADTDAAPAAALNVIPVAESNTGQSSNPVDSLNILTQFDHDYAFPTSTNSKV